MTSGKKFKRRVRERMAETGESYTTARDTASTRVDTRGILAWCPEHREMQLRDGWVIAAESWPNDAGSIFWDVRAEHPDGTRIPPNHNWHEDPTLEMFRLAKVID